MYTVTVSVRGQIALPVEARKKMGIKEGDVLTILEEGEKLILRTNCKRDIKKGIVAKTAGLLSDIDVSGKEFVENLRKGSGRRLAEFESNT